VARFEWEWEYRKIGIVCLKKSVACQQFVMCYCSTSDRSAKN